MSLENFQQRNNPHILDWLKYMEKMRDELKEINTLQYDLAMSIFWSIYETKLISFSPPACCILEDDEDLGPSFHMSWWSKGRAHTFNIDIFKSGEVEWFYANPGGDKSHDGDDELFITELPEQALEYTKYLDGSIEDLL